MDLSRDSGVQLTSQSEAPQKNYDQENTTKDCRTIVDILPVELLGEIIDIVVSEHCGSMPTIENWGYHHRFYQWLKYTHICQLWRLIALRMPRIWRHIALTTKDCVHTMMDRSKGAGLHIYLPFLDWDPRSEDDTDLIYQALGTQQHRVERVDLYLRRPMYEMLWRRLKDTPLRHLEQIVIHFKHFVSDPELGLPLRICDSPMKHIELYGWGAIQQHLLPLSVSNTYLKICHADCFMPLQELLDNLNRAPNLQTLFIVSAGFPISSTSPSTCCLPQLRSLDLHANGDMAFCMLPSLQIPDTCDITFTDGGLGPILPMDMLAGVFADKYMHTPFTILSITCEHSENMYTAVKARTASNRVLSIYLYTWRVLPLPSFLSFLPVTQVHTLTLKETITAYSLPQTLETMWMCLQQVPNVENLKLETPRAIPLLTCPPDTDSPDTSPTLHDQTETHGQFIFPKLRHLDISLDVLDESVGLALFNMLVARREAGLTLKTLTLHGDAACSGPQEPDVQSENLSRETYTKIQHVLGECVLHLEGLGLVGNED
ncbi:hypothetical protein K474DRAFT_75444 [Panus rudis PR-1116 ss-1]|nr:hypothetical protein K474DRAFT_75444 [Panus rudis PR-1116 ss-1]